MSGAMALQARGVQTFHRKSRILHGAIMVLAKGKIFAESIPQEIAANEAVQSAYLGKAA